jgi:hypothetical protein
MSAVQFMSLENGRIGASVFISVDAGALLLDPDT